MEGLERETITEQKTSRFEEIETEKWQSYRNFGDPTAKSAGNMQVQEPRHLKETSQALLQFLTSFSFLRTNGKVKGHTGVEEDKQCRIDHKKEAGLFPLRF